MPQLPTLKSMYLSLPRLSEEAEVEGLLQKHFEQMFREENARWEQA